MYVSFKNKTMRCHDLVVYMALKSMVYTNWTLKDVIGIAVFECVVLFEKQI